MEPSRIEPGQTYSCVFGDSRYRAMAVEKTNSLVLVRLQAKLDGGRVLGPSDAAEVGTEMWVAPESIEPIDEAGT